MLLTYYSSRSNPNHRHQQPCSAFMISRPFTKFLRVSVAMAILLFFTMLQVEVRRMMEVNQEDEFQRSLDMKRVVSYNRPDDDAAASDENAAAADNGNYYDPELLYIDADTGDQLNQKLLLNRIIRRPRFKAGKKTLLSAHKVASVEEDEDSDIQTAFEEIAVDKSFMGVPLQPWADDDSVESFQTEARRFLQYITTIQTLCNDIRDIGRADNTEEWPLRACYDSKSREVGGCVVYSFGPKPAGSSFDIDMARTGCELHVFNPMSKVKAESYADKSIFPHQYSLDWREATARGPSASPWVPKKLSSIMADLGHTKIDILQADLQGSEWRILESLMLDKTVHKIRQLILKINIHWSGFEVQGSNTEVVRFWYSLLKHLENNNFKIFYSYRDRTHGPQTILGKSDFNASSTYTLGWMNTAWR